MKLCQREGCVNPARSRGLCNSCYGVWYRSLAVKPAKQVSDTIICDELKEGDGTYHDLVARTGVCYRIVRKVMNELHADGKIHVIDHQAPDSRGSRWKKIFAFGPGKDHKVKERIKWEHTNTSRQRAFKLRKVIPARDPSVACLFGAP